MTDAIVTNPLLSWKKSLWWVVVGAVFFNLTYQWMALPALGLLIFGYALALVRLTNQATVRRAFYFGLATGIGSYAPQLLFFWNIFGPAAMVLWLVLAFWVGLFTAIICGVRWRWGRRTALWLIPVVWTGVEYFRSELYYLKFSWLNVGYALPVGHGGNVFIKLGMYGLGFLVFAIAGLVTERRRFKGSQFAWAGIGLFCLGVVCCFSAFISAMRYERPNLPVGIIGVQLEFANEYVVAKSLDRAFKQHPESQIFVLSEYTLDGPVTDKLKNWCREQGRYLVVGGKEHLTNDDYYNTTYVIGTNSEIVFQQAKSVPIQFFKDGRPAPSQKVWESPWGKIGLCICYDLSYTRVTDELIRQGAQLLIVPTMDVAEWGRHQHELHSRVAPVRAAEYGVPIFRLASSGISQAVNGYGDVPAHTSFPGSGDVLSAELHLPMGGSLPLDRWLAPVCVVITAVVLGMLLWLDWRGNQSSKHRRTSQIQGPAGIDV